ncbi:MAG TPA: hypothetical protein H9706_05500 [Candidatus Gemmiger stercorigallinarum]|nr:hypothetical protein [Candidatus Gemmiger stercorigallinarum]
MPELLLRPDPLLLRAELLRVPELRPAEDGRCAEDFADDLPERDCAMIHVPLLLKAPRPFSGVRIRCSMYPGRRAGRRCAVPCFPVSIEIYGLLF